MTQQRRPVVVVSILALFFLAGLATVLLGGSSNGEPIQPEPDQASENVLVLGVDSLSAAQPRLVAVWLATFDPRGRALLLLGQPVDATVCSSPPATLRELFRWQAESGLDPTFLAAFEAADPDAVVVADETAFAALIDELQGVDLQGTRLDSAQVVAVLRTLYENPGGLLSSQEQFLIALARRATDPPRQIDLTRLVDLIPDHAYSSVPPQDLITLYLRLLPLGPSSVLVYAAPTPAVECPG